MTPRLRAAPGGGTRLLPGDVEAVGHAVLVAEAGTPDPDDRFRGVDDPADADGVSFIRLLAAEAAVQLEGKDPANVLRWAAGVVPRFAVTSSFGAESAVLLHLLSRAAPQVPVVFLDTGFHFGETMTFRRELASHLGLTVLDVRPDLSVAMQAQRYGEDLFASDPDTCCRLRKTRPLRRLMGSFDGWATGVRRAQTPERAATPVVEAREHDGRWLVKVAPLAAWGDEDVDAYLRTNDLPRHPLVEQGYRSIGCAPCTRPTGAAQDPRAGRWSAFDDKTECGIHLAEDGSLVRAATTPG